MHLRVCRDFVYYLFTSVSPEHMMKHSKQQILNKYVLSKVNKQIWNVKWGLENTATEGSPWLWTKREEKEPCSWKLAPAWEQRSLVVTRNIPEKQGEGIFHSTLMAFLTGYSFLFLPLPSSHSALPLTPLKESSVLRTVWPLENPHTGLPAQIPAAIWAVAREAKAPMGFQHPSPESWVPSHAWLIYVCMNCSVLT